MAARSAFSDYVGGPYEKSKLQVTVIAPGPQFWGNGDRLIVCVLFDHERLKGSQKASDG